MLNLEVKAVSTTTRVGREWYYSWIRTQWNSLWTFHRAENVEKLNGFALLRMVTVSMFGRRFGQFKTLYLATQAAKWKILCSNFLVLKYGFVLKTPNVELGH